ncbi:hypothetical protein ACL6C3_20525 [Capilliphycus salinus ALCB114379]|uniref:hypothetical protein n=1 Tax=Capilliphycus salinus TaxID=2768948 RepID=UPI0039A49F79
MLKQQQNKFKTVQLTEGVLVLTAFDDACIPALRSGFAGYPVNPRWNAVKFHAWKTGRQWRVALSEGEMTVRSTDSMLVSKHEVEQTTESELPRRSREKNSQSFFSNHGERSGELTLA